MNIFGCRCLLISCCLYVFLASGSLVANAAPSVIYVATNGSDDNSGTRAEPYESIAKAIDDVASGGTIIVRGGEYRGVNNERVSKQLTIRSYEDERAWLKGSVVVDGWSSSINEETNSTVWTTRWTNTFNNSTECPAENEIACKTDQFFIDGARLVQVENPGDVTAGTFAIDSAAELVTIGSNPSGKRIEGSVLESAFIFEGNGATGSVVEGLGFTQYSPSSSLSSGDSGMVKGNVDNLTFKENFFQFSATKGLTIYKAGATVEGNVFRYNGMVGLSANTASDLEVSGNFFFHNNQEHFVIEGEVAEAAGAKITKSNGIVVKDNIFNDNEANGLWIDLEVSNAQITRNLAINNKRHGIYYEVSRQGIIASNLLVGNKDTGLVLTSSKDIAVYNNTFSRNNASVYILNTERKYITGDIHFYNNIFSEDTGSIPLIRVKDVGNLIDSQLMLTESDHNAFYRPVSTRPAELVEWWQTGANQRYTSLSDYQIGTGRDTGSFIVEDVPENPFFINPGEYFALKDDRLIGAGRVLPPEVAAAVGFPVNVQPNLGAINPPDIWPFTRE